MMPAARPMEKRERLLHILMKEAEVEESVAKWIVEADAGPQCESPADFAKLWTQATVADGTTDRYPLRTIAAHQH